MCLYFDSKLVEVCYLATNRCDYTWTDDGLFADAYTRALRELKHIIIEVVTKWTTFRTWRFQTYVLQFFFFFSIRISQSFVSKGRIKNIPALVRIMAWRRPCDKPLSEAMVVSLQTHICVTQSQWAYTWWCNMSVTRKPQITDNSTFFQRPLPANIKREHQYSIFDPLWEAIPPLTSHDIMLTIVWTGVHCT